MNEQEAKKGIEAAIKNFAGRPLAEVSAQLFKTLGYSSEKRLPLEPNSFENFIGTFAQGKTVNENYALPTEWKSIDFLFQITDDEIRAAGNQQFLFESKGVYNGAVINSYLFFALELKGSQYTRTVLSGITRELNKLFAMPALIIFRHGDTLTLAVINRRLHKREETKDVLEKVTLIKDIRFASPHRAHIEILFDLSLGALHENHEFANFVQLQAAWQKTLDSSELNKRFFQEIANWYFWASDHVKFPKPKDTKDGDTYKAQSLIRLITRLIFCWFVKEKGLLPDDLFNPVKLQTLLKEGDKLAIAKHTVYYKAILQNLFFATLNREMNTPDEPDNRKFRGRTKQKNGRDQHHMIHNVCRYEDAFQDSKKAMQVFSDIPFLNGGLFECLDKTVGPKEKPEYIRIDGFSDRDDNPLAVPDFLFFGDEREVDLSAAYGETRFKRAKVRGLIHTFYRYKFTITENTPIEEEIALDPELAGKVFENLLAAYNPETATTARKQTGAFFTPREIVNYMVDETLITCLQTKLQFAIPNPQSAFEPRLRHLVAYNDELHKFTPQEVDALIAAIDSLKSLDPAVGSGAFPMGILHKLVFILGKLDPRNEKWKERQVARVRDAMAAADKIEDGTVRERAVRELEQQITGINEAFEHNELDYGRKLYLIENCIYGVDIQPIAVQIAKMRFFISLIVDQKIDDTQPNRGVRPLPNLETKFVAANTLIGVNRPGQQLLRNRDIDAKEAELRRVREHHFLARGTATKAKYRAQDAKLRAEIADLLKTDGWDTATAKKLAAWDPYDQNASAGFFDPEWMFGITEGFDVVIGNPPYIEFKKLEQKFKSLYEPTYKSATGKYDIYVLFIEHAKNCLRGRGHLAFINPTTFLKKDFGAAIRKLIAQEFMIFRILDFADFQVFDGVTNYTGIFILQTSKPTKYSFPYHKYRHLDGETDAASFASSLQTVVSNELKDVITVESPMLGNGPWDFHTSDIAALLAKLDASGTPLIKLSESIFQGIASGKDEVFYVDSETISEWSIEKKLLLPLLKGQNVKRYLINWSDQYVIYPYDQASKPIPETKLKQEFPKGYAYLAANRDLLRGRSYFDNSAKFWYELWNQRKRGNFERLRIVTPEISDRNNFALTKRFAGNTKTYHIVLNEGEETNYHFVLGLLNSRLLQFYYCSITAPMAGGFYAYKTQFLEKLPIRDSNKTANKRVVELVGRILAAKEKNPDADTSALQREIDEQVYALYGLLPEEIKIVEKSAHWSSGKGERA